jgi:hypothetical protein
VEVASAPELGIGHPGRNKEEAKRPKKKLKKRRAKRTCSKTKKEKADDSQGQWRGGNEAAPEVHAPPRGPDT